MDDAKTNILAFLNFSKADRTQIYSTSPRDGSTPRSNLRPA